jgi:hypothetical protein
MSAIRFDLCDLGHMYKSAAYTALDIEKPGLKSIIEALHSLFSFTYSPADRQVMVAWAWFGSYRHSMTGLSNWIAGSCRTRPHLRG